jgi:hypothetical protein
VINQRYAHCARFKKYVIRINKAAMETNIKIVEFGERLNLTVKKIKLVGEKLTDEQIHRACAKVARQFKIAAIPLILGEDQFLLVEVHDTIPVKTLNVDDWVINLEATSEISRLSVNVKKEQRQIADLYKRSLLINIENELGLWTLDSPRIFYEKSPFIKSELTNDLSSPVTDIDAYRRYEISEMFVENVGLGFSVGIGTAFFSNLSVEEYYSSNLEKRLQKLVGRQKEQKGTLLYDGPTGRLKCYFEMYKTNVTLESAPGFVFSGKTFANPYEYFKKVHPHFKVARTDKAALVSFPGMGKKVYVPANRLFVRVMNEMVDYEMSQVDKIIPDDRMALIGDLWKNLGEKPFGRNYVKVKDGFYKPDSSNSGQIDLPQLLFGKGQILPPPISKTKDDYRQHFRSRKEYLNKFGCFFVPPTMNRTIHFVFPEGVDDRLKENFSKEICARVKGLTGISVSPAIVSYQDYLNGIQDLLTNFEPGMAVFVFEDIDPTVYFNIRYELKNWKIKRVTKYQLLKKYKGLNDFKDGRFSKGEKNWNSFLEINTYDIIQQLGCLPYVIEPKLNYEMQLMIDVSDKSSHIALSLVMYKDGMRVPVFDSLIKPKTDSQKETINPVFLERYLIELFTKNKTLIGKWSFKSMLVLRDGKNCGDEYDALVSAVEKLKSKGTVDRDLKFAFVEYHKSTLKEIRLLEKEQGRYHNVVEGSYFLPDKDTAILATTGCGTLNQGTAAPVLLHSPFKDCDLVAVINDVFVTSQLNFSSPSVAQRITFAAKRADEQLKDRIAQEVIRIK